MDPDSFGLSNAVLLLRWSLGKILYLSSVAASASSLANAWWAI